jgi:hypothetical protein
MSLVLRAPARRRLAHACLAVAATVLAACGGSDSSSEPPPPPPPPPVPAIGLNPTTLSFATQAGTTPTTSTTTVAIANAAQGTLTGLSLGTITYGAGATGWLTAALSGTSAPASVTVTANWAGLAAGSYTATIPVASSVTGVAPVSITATLTVAAPPAIRLVPDNASFSAIVGGANPAPQSVVVDNGGGGTLNGLSLGTITYTGPTTGWLAASIGGQQAATSVSLTANVASLQPGVYLAQVPVRSTATGVSNSPQNINVAFTVSFPPSSLALRPSNALTFNAPQGGAVAGPQTLRIVQGNGSQVQLGGLSLGPVTYGPGATGWLVIDRAPGAVTPDSVRVTVGDIRALAVGSYSANFEVRTTAAGVAAVPVTVRLDVGAATPPRIQLSRDSVVMAMQAGGALPPAEELFITNGGTAPLTGLSIRIIDPTGNWLAPQLSPSGNGATLSVRPNSVAQGFTAPRTVRTVIELSSNAPGALNSPVNIPVVLQIR